MPKRYDLKPPRRRRATANKPRRNRARSDEVSDQALAYWIAGALVLIIVLLIVVVKEMPTIHGWMTALHSAPTPEITRENPAPSPESAQSDEMMRHLEQKLAAEKKHQETERAKAAAAKEQADAAAAQSSKNPLTPNQMTEAQAADTVRTKENPALTGIPIARPTGGPARALPLDPNVLTTERIAAYQVALERMHFSCGFIDGDQGMRTQRMLRAFQQSRNLPRTGVLDAATPRRHRRAGRAVSQLHGHAR